MTNSQSSSLRIRLALEAFVIVGSILLAFGVDALWERRQDSGRIAEYLDALETEFVEARDEITGQETQHTEQLAAIDNLLITFDSGVRSDSIQSWLSYLNGIFVYGPAHPVFTDLANSGSIDLLESTELRLALLAYGQAKDFLAVSSDRELQGWQGELRPYLFERIDALPIMMEIGMMSDGMMPAGLTPRFDSGIEDLYADRKFQNLLLTRRLQVVSQLNLDARVADGVARVLDEIGKAH